MSETLVRAVSTNDEQGSGARTRVWRPFPAEVADVLCVEHAGADVTPQIYERLSVTLIRSAAVIRCESSRSLVAARNCVLIVPALQLYSVRAQGHVTGRSVTLLVGGPQLKGLELNDRAGLVTEVALVERVEALIAELSRPVHFVECATAIRAMLQRLTAPGAMRPTAGLHAGRVYRVRDRLRDNPSEPLSVSELADVSELTESHLIRAFHREFGLPPHAYHLRRKLARASELLASRLSVSTVAYECGFADQSHLSRKFKEVYGLTPATWATAVCPGGRHTTTPKEKSVGIPRRDTHLSRAMSC